MGNESGEWIMRGLPDDDPDCVHTFDELSEFIREAGFLPLFSNEIEGFSVEEFANPRFWWTGNEERDPWEWRKYAARSREMAYGKFFGGKAGIISLEWLPYFIAFRRNGEDFESLWYAGRIQFRQKKIMDCLMDAPELPGWELRRQAGFGRDGEKNFEGTVTALQDRLFVTISDFRQRKNKFGLDYGWDVSVYARPEEIWGSALIDEAYAIRPRDAYYEIREQMKARFPGVTEKQFEALIGKKPEAL